MDNIVLYKTRRVAAGNVADILIFQYTQQLIKNLNDKLIIMNSKEIIVCNIKLLPLFNKIVVNHINIFKNCQLS